MYRALDRRIQCKSLQVGCRILSHRQCMMSRQYLVVFQQRSLCCRGHRCQLEQHGNLHRNMSCRSALRHLRMVHILLQHLQYHLHSPYKQSDLRSALRQHRTASTDLRFLPIQLDTPHSWTDSHLAGGQLHILHKSARWRLPLRLHSPDIGSV
eukprot:SAG31_NODE_1197_length_9441_cov_5.823592_5_plen_153_part_00